MSDKTQVDAIPWPCMLYGKLKYLIRGNSITGFQCSTPNMSTNECQICNQLQGNLISQMCDRDRCFIRKDI